MDQLFLLTPDQISAATELDLLRGIYSISYTFLSIAIIGLIMLFIFPILFIIFHKVLYK